MPKANETPRVFTTVATLTMAAIFAWGSQIRTVSGFVWPAIILGSGLFLQWNPLAGILWRRIGSPIGELTKSIAKGDKVAISGFGV